MKNKRRFSAIGIPNILKLRFRRVLTDIFYRMKIGQVKIRRIHQQTRPNDLRSGWWATGQRPSEPERAWAKVHSAPSIWPIKIWPNEIRLIEIWPITIQSIEIRPIKIFGHLRKTLFFDKKRLTIWDSAIWGTTIVHYLVCLGMLYQLPIFYPQTNPLGSPCALMMVMIFKVLEPSKPFYVYIWITYKSRINFSKKSPLGNLLATLMNFLSIYTTITPLSRLVDTEWQKTSTSTFDR